MVLGANTFRQFLDLLGSASAPTVTDPVNTRMRNLPTTVVSTTLEGPLDWPDATLESGDALEVVARLKEESAVPLRSHGSLSMNWALLAAGLVDRVQVTVFPGRSTATSRSSPIGPPRMAENAGSLWPRLAQLPLTVDGQRFDRLDPGPGAGDAHPSRLVRLMGAGGEGLGEDITLFVGGAAPQLDLAGEWTLGSFCEHLHTVDQWPEPPPDEFRNWVERFRNWAFESAALDLALQQAGEPLHAVLGRTPRPVTFVNSLGLGDPPDPDTILRRRERYPELRFKLDAAASWTPEVIDALVGTGAVHTLDFKGRYGLEVEDEAALVRAYERLIDAFPEAVLEDPHDLPDIAPLLEPHAARVAYDAPIATVADLARTPIPAVVFNVKPTRVGRLDALFDLYAECERRGALLYGGGMGELGVARGQIQLLASLFSPDGPNDVAPPGFNALEPEAGLPVSPLEPRPAASGFRRD